MKAATNLLVTCAVALYCSLPAIADPIPIIGFGNMSCRAALPYIADKEWGRLFTAWTTGFASGANVVAEVTGQRQIIRKVDDLTAEKIISAMHYHCARNKESTLAVAVQEVYTQQARAALVK